MHWNVFAITPPLNITREELDEGLEILDEVLAIADEYYDPVACAGSPGRGSE